MSHVTFDLGIGAIRSYKRLSYTPWHAIAEFVDNSTQSYLDNEQALAAGSTESGDPFYVSVTYDRTDGVFRVADNAMGMDRKDLDRALQVGVPPDDPTGRSEYGMGMKTAACWIGDRWTVRTTRLGVAKEFEVTVDVEAVAGGATKLDVIERKAPVDDHYTIVEVGSHHHEWRGRTLGKIKDFLRSMYRVDLREERLRLEWQGAALLWDDPADAFVTAKDGKPYRKAFKFRVGGKDVSGWVGVLERGSRAKAGFSILRRGRVIKGWPESWRPQKIYGQIGGSNDLVNQRLTGEITLDAFTVTHTKDDILWISDEEDKVETKLKEKCADYITVAKRRKKGDGDERGPSDLEVNTALEEFQAELESGELVDGIDITPLPPPDVIKQGFEPLTDAAVLTDPAFTATVSDVTVKGYLAADASANDPYVAVETSEADLLVVINLSHPHWKQITGAEGVLNYFRHCTYDAVAEWLAANKAGNLDPDTIKILKDRLLRVSFEIETHLSEDESPAEEAAETLSA